MHIAFINFHLLYCLKHVFRLLRDGFAQSHLCSIFIRCSYWDSCCFAQISQNFFSPIYFPHLMYIGVNVANQQSMCMRNGKFSSKQVSENAQCMCYIGSGIKSNQTIFFAFYFCRFCDSKCRSKILIFLQWFSSQ